jgi:hypothetical protein
VGRHRSWHRWSRWIALVLLALGATACGATHPHVRTVPQPLPRGFHLGVIANTLGAGSQIGAAQAAVNRLGVDWIREELDWPTAEPRPGTFRWRTFDRLFATASRHHLHVLPMLLGTPRWTGAQPLALPPHPAQFAEFAARLARRYGPGGTFWRDHPDLDARYAPTWFELWNEPYTVAYSTDGVAPARYARLVVDATRAGRAANPRTKWLMAADLDYETPDGASRNWLAALYAAVPDLNSFFDGVAVHPYSFFAPDAGPSVAPLDQRFARVGAIEQELRRRGAGDKPVWITELGWSTCELRPACTSQRDQARWLTQALALVGTRYARFVRALFVYHLDDFAGPGGDRADHYGLRDLDGSHKPAWAVVHAAARTADR